MFVTDDGVRIVDEAGGDNAANADCPNCGADYERSSWESVGGYGGWVHRECPTDGCGGSVKIYVK